MRKIFYLFIIAPLFLNAQSGDKLKDSSYIVPVNGKFAQGRYIEYESGHITNGTDPALTADELHAAKLSEFEQSAQTMANDVRTVSTYSKRLTELKRQNDAIKALTGKSPLDTIQTRNIAAYLTAGWTIKENGSTARDIVFTVTAQGQFRYKIGTDAVKNATFFGYAIRLNNHLGTGTDTDIFKRESGNFTDAIGRNILRKPGSVQQQIKKKK